MRKRSRKDALILLPAAAVAVLLIFFSGLSDLDRGHMEAGREQLERAVRRGAVACYALEGIYPPDLEYLKEHYGVQIDEERYAVFYEAVGSNLMPDVTVLIRE